MYYQKLIYKYQSNPQQLWNMINEIAGKSNLNKVIIDKIKQSNDIILYLDVIISNEFNNFFINVGKNV